MKTKFLTIIAAIAFALTACGPEPITVTSVTLDPTEVSIPVNQSKTLKATLNEGAQGDITWTSSDESIATVNGGVVTPVKIGNTTITATCETKSATCEVTVVEAVDVFTVYYKANGNGEKTAIDESANIDVTYIVEDEMAPEGQMKFKGYLQNNSGEKLNIKVKATRETVDTSVVKDEFCGTLYCQQTNATATQVFDFGSVAAGEEEEYYSSLTPQDATKAGDYKVTYEFYEEGKEDFKVTAVCTFKYEPKAAE